MSPQRKIIHVDMDAFFASVEQRDHPEYRGRPLVVGGKPQSRGVVAAASYEARVFGVRSAMSSAKAYSLCPQALFVPPRFAVYRAVSQQLMEILRDYSDLVEPLSLDEAYVDVTENKRGLSYASETAKEMRKRIYEELELTASAGVAPNKFLAKIASDINKPNGLTVIPPERVEEFLRELPVRKIPGIGRVTEEKMAKLGIFTTADLRAWGEEALTEEFGKHGAWYYRIARGEDERPVVSHRERKSMSVEDTFPHDLTDPDEMSEQLHFLSRRLFQRLERRGLMGTTVTLKVTFDDFSKATRSQTFPEPVLSADILREVAVELLSKTEAGARAVRLLGVGVSHFERGSEEPAPSKGAVQLSFPF